MSNFSTLRPQTMDEFNQENKDYITPLEMQDPDYMPVGDVLKTEELVSKIHQLALNILAQKTEMELNRTSVKKSINSIIYPLKMRAMALDRIFNNPPRGDYPLARSGASICVY